MKLLAIVIFLMVHLQSCHSQDKENEPKKLNWAMIPIRGDKDTKEKVSQLLKEYNGVKVIAEGIAMGSRGESRRSITITIGRLEKRGELVLKSEIDVTFNDVDLRRYRAIASSNQKIKVIGIAKPGNAFVFLAIKDAQIVVDKNAKK